MLGTLEFKGLEILAAQLLFLEQGLDPFKDLQQIAFDVSATFSPA